MDSPLKMYITVQDTTTASLIEICVLQEKTAVSFDIQEVIWYFHSTHFINSLIIVSKCVNATVKSVAIGLISH